MLTFKKSSNTALSDSLDEQTAVKSVFAQSSEPQQEDLRGPVGDPADEQPLFLDEPQDLPQPAPADTSHIDTLFADEHEAVAPAAAAPGFPLAWRAGSDTAAPGTPRASRTSPRVLLVVIFGGAVVGFAFALLLLA